MAANDIFARIIRGDIPADIVYRDENCIAFRDINPQAPTHILVTPIRDLSGLQTAGDDDAAVLGHLMIVVRKVAEMEGIIESGFRCIINAGPDGGQEVPRLHIHVLGGKRLGAMLR